MRECVCDIYHSNYMQKSWASNIFEKFKKLTWNSWSNRSKNVQCRIDFSFRQGQVWIKIVINTFIVFYVVIGTLSHAKIILELLLQNDKAKAFSEGGDSPSTPSSWGGDSLDPTPDAHQEWRGRDNKKGKGIFLKLGWLTLLRQNLNLI